MSYHNRRDHYRRDHYRCDHYRRDHYCRDHYRHDHYRHGNFHCHPCIMMIIVVMIVIVECGQHNHEHISWTHFTLSLSDFLKFHLKGLAEPDKIILNCNTVVQVGLKARHFAVGTFLVFLKHKDFYLFRFEMVWFSSSFSTWS